MGEPTDEQLFERFCEGEEPAFDALFTRHAPALEAFLVRMVADSSLAEDLVQATFLSVVRSRDRFQRGSRVAPWLFSIAANAARDALRHRRRVTEEELVPETQAHASAGLPGDPGLQKRLAIALQELPLPQREAVVLHHVLGWTYEEMGEACGATTVTMRVRAHRGFERLRALLGDLENDL